MGQTFSIASFHMSFEGFPVAEQTRSVITPVTVIDKDRHSLVNNFARTGLCVYDDFD